MYKVIKNFIDLQDKRHLYKINDTFPREGQDVSSERISELSGNKNKQGYPLITSVVSTTDKTVTSQENTKSETTKKAPTKKQKKTDSKKAE